MKIETKQIRAELKNNFFFIRNLQEKGGVINGLVNDKKAKKVSDILSKITTETFVEVWQKIITIKGVKVDYASN